ncbi:MAG: 2Fe-2S iron-sulfur cluster-binding protein, partial [Planctomycetota bacterium]
MKHFKITFKPDDKQITIHKRATLFEAAGQAGIIMNTTCGGKGICGKCEATLEPGAENVLACQYRIEKDLTVTIPVSSRFFEQKILAEGIETEAGIQPDIYEKYLEIQPEEQ